MTEIVEVEQPQITLSAAKWKAYLAYKDSGIEWLGEIPEHWEVTPLYTRYSIQLGKMRNQEQITGLILAPYLRNINVQWDFVDTTDVLEMDFHPQERRKYALKYGDLLVCEGGEVGRTAIWRNELGECYIQNAVHRVRPLSHREEGRFLFYILYMVAKQGVFEAEVNRSTIGHLTSEKLKKYRFMFPPLKEQHTISAFLDRENAKINALIAKKERLIELLQEKRAALISHAVTKGLDPDVTMKDSGVEWLGEIPEHWEVRRLKFMASILRGKFSHRPRNDPQLYDGPYPFIQTGDITATTRYITEYQQTLNELGFAVSKQFPNGTLVMAIAANIGDLAILQFPACFPDSVVGFVPTKQVVLDYLYYNLKAMKQLMMSTATINTQLNLNVERISGLFTVCPSLSEQKAICSYLEEETARIDALISKVGEAIEKLREYSAALISAVVTGKIDVRDKVTSIYEE